MEGPESFAKAVSSWEEDCRRDRDGKGSQEEGSGQSLVGELLGATEGGHQEGAAGVGSPSAPRASSHLSPSSLIPSCPDLILEGQKRPPSRWKEQEERNQTCLKGWQGRKYWIKI